MTTDSGQQTLKRIANSIILTVIALLVLGIVGLSIVIGIFTAVAKLNKEFVPGNEHIFYQDDDCVVTGRHVRIYDWGPAEHQFDYILMCRFSDDHIRYAPYVFYQSSGPTMAVENVGEKSITLVFCSADADELVTISNAISDAQVHFPEEMHLTFNLREDSSACLTEF